MSEDKRDIRDYIQDILTSITDVEEFIKGMTFEYFSKDKKTVNAVIEALRFWEKQPDIFQETSERNIKKSPGPRCLGYAMY